MLFDQRNTFTYQKIPSFIQFSTNILEIFSNKNISLESFITSFFTLCTFSVYNTVRASVEIKISLVKLHQKVQGNKSKGKQNYKYVDYKR